MKKYDKLQGFFKFQFLTSSIIVIICTLVMSVTSYHVLQDKLMNWLIDNNSKVLEQYSETINNLIVSNSSKIYMQILNDMTVDKHMKYYASFSLKDNMLDTLHIKDYLSSIQESNPLI